MRTETNKKVAWIIIGLMALLLPLSSCRLLEQPAEQTAAPSLPETETIEAPLPVEGSLDVKIEIWNYINPKERLTLIDSVEEFMAENPGVAVETRHIRSEEELLDQFEAASLAGSGPDLILTDLVNVQRLAENKVIKEITDLDYQQFLNGLSEISVYEGKNYGIPFRAEDFLVFYYNQDYINSPPGDFEALLEYCQEVNDEQQQIYGFMLNEMEADWIIPFIGGYSDWIVDYANYSLSLDSEGTIKTLEFLLMIYDQQEPLIPRTTGYEEMNAMFKSGNLHMIINSITAAEEYISENLNIGVARIPEVYGENRRPTPLIWGTGFMINANCYGQELEATQSFIDFMLSDQQQIKWTRDTGTLPATIAAKDDEYIRDNRILADAFTQAQLCRGIPPDSIIRAIRDSIRINLPKVLEEEFPIEEAVAKIQEDGIRLRSGSITVEQLMEESLQQ